MAAAAVARHLAIWRAAIGAGAVLYVRLRALRGRGDSYSDMSLRLTAGDQPIRE